MHASPDALRTSNTKKLGEIVKYTKWHTLVFKCPSCGDETDYALHVDDGGEHGSPWDPTYWCAHCERPARVRDPWLFGLVYGPLMAMVAALAYEALTVFTLVAPPVGILFAALSCGVIGWPVSRVLSRHLLAWEPRRQRSTAVRGRLS